MARWNLYIEEKRSWLAVLGFECEFKGERCTETHGQFFVPLEAGTGAARFHLHLLVWERPICNHFHS